MSEFLSSPTTQRRILAVGAALALMATLGACGSGGGEGRTSASPTSTAEMPNPQLSGSAGPEGEATASSNPDDGELPYPDTTYNPGECSFAEQDQAYRGQAVVVQAGVGEVNGNWYGRPVVLPEAEEGGAPRLARMAISTEGMRLYDVGALTDEVFYATPSVAKGGRTVLAPHDQCPLPDWTKNLPEKAQRYLQVVTLTGSVAAEDVLYASFTPPFGGRQAASRVEAWQKQQAVGIYLGSGQDPAALGLIKVQE